MIIVQLIGGLGNQLFQYALAKKLQTISGFEVKIDTSEFKQYALHKYALDAYNISIPIATEEEVERCKASHILNELHFHYWEGVFDVKDWSYVVGYWQSELYFKDIRDQVLEEFSLKESLSKEVEQKWGFSETDNLVSIHVRRGDYVSNPLTNKIHGTCDVQYYIEAINIVKRENANSRYMFFSDDLKWVEEALVPQLNINDYYLIDYNGVEKNFLDIYLMSLCRTNIIANSSFSWWGAWLSQKTNKLVIAPKKWFSQSPYNDLTLVPEDWKRV